jgi:hypothetical protein
VVLTLQAAALKPSTLKFNQFKTNAPPRGHKEIIMALQEWSMELLTVVLALLDDADPKSEAAIKARQLLTTKITN